jgi:hypothetical protein
MQLGPYGQYITLPPGFEIWADSDPDNSFTLEDGAYAMIGEYIIERDCFQMDLYAPGTAYDGEIFYLSRRYIKEKVRQNTLDTSTDNLTGES